MLDLTAALEALDANPVDDVLIEAVRTLATTGRWPEALKRARAALRAKADRESVVLALGQGALAGGRPDLAEKALGELPKSPVRRREIVRLRVWVLEALGRADEARSVAEAHVARDLDDEEAAGWLRAWRRHTELRGTEPLESIDVAMRMQRAGHPAAALRLARRVQLAHPDSEEVAEAAETLTQRAAQYLPHLPTDAWSQQIIALPTGSEYDE